MKTNFKTLYFTLIALLGGALLFVSCDKQEDKYSIGDFIVSFGIVEKTPDAAEGSYQIRLDNGDRFVSVTPYTKVTNTHAGERVFVNFAPFDDKLNPDNTKTIYGNINLINSILYKDVLLLSAVNEDSIGHDPINLKDSWITGDSILSVGFSYYTAGSVHAINLADISEGNGADKPFVFELRHNAKGDLLSYKASGYVSFKLARYRIAGLHKVSFVVRYTDYEGKRVDIPHSISY